MGTCLVQQFWGLNTDREPALAQAAHAWGAQGVPFNDEPKTELFRTAPMERATALLKQSAALRRLMLLSGENGVGKSALAGRCLRSHRALYSRIAVHARIEGLSRSEVEPKRKPKDALELTLSAHLKRILRVDLTNQPRVDRARYLKRMCYAITS